MLSISNLKNPSGFISINKEVGISSNLVVCKTRKILSSIFGYKVKAGHLGTLDPQAEGVVVVTVGKATRMFDYFINKKKEYIARIKFGVETTTLDAEGEVVKTSLLPKYDNLKNNIHNFIGKVYQVPPNYSAISINGVKAYKLAREGKDISSIVENRGKVVEIDSIELFDPILKEDKIVEVSAKILCGGGTYIRSLCRDIAYSCNCVAYMSNLIRTKVGDFSIETSQTLEEFANDAKITKIDDVLFKLYDRIDINSEDVFKVKNGVPINYLGQDKQKNVVYINNELYGISIIENNKLKIITNLWQN